MWTSIYISKSENKVQKIKEKMEEDGFMVKVFLNKDSEHEVQVPKGEATEAHEALMGVLTKV